MLKLIESETFFLWRRGLKDPQARFRINARLRRLAQGNPGDVQPVGDGLSELRIDYGLGYRVYFQQYGSMLIVVFAGGDKRTQAADIKLAKRLAAAWKE